MAVRAPGLLAVALLLPSGGGAASAQSFGEEVVVTAVEVPVQVLVRGEPVRGLTAADFELFDDGVLQEVAAFEVLDLATPGVSPAVPEGAAAPAPLAPLPEAARSRHLLLLFDLQFSAGRHLRRALPQARMLVESGLHPSDRVAVALYSGSTGVRILSGFDRDREQAGLALTFLESLFTGRPKRVRESFAALQSARRGRPESSDKVVGPLLAQLGPAAALALADAAGDRGVGPGGPVTPGAGSAFSIVSTADLSGSVSYERMVGLGDLGAGPLLSQVRSFGLAFADLATLLRDVPEPKHLLYFSQGFPSFLLGMDFLTPVVARLEPMLEAFRSSGWVLQGLDLQGVPPPPSTSVEIGPEDSAAYLATAGSRGPERLGSDAAALHYLASRTGGQVYENFNRIGEAARLVLERTRVTYVLTFYPRDLASDGRYRPLEVRLRQPIPGARLLHRPGYHAPKPLRRRSPLERRMDAARLLLRGAPLDPLGASVTGRPVPGEGRTMVEVEVPTAELLRQTTRGRARIDLHLFATDESGAPRDALMKSAVVDVERMAERPNDGRLAFGGELRLPPGSYRIQVLARELGSGRSLLTTTALTVPPGPDS